MTRKSLPVRWNPAMMAHEAHCPDCKELAFMLTHEFVAQNRDLIKVPFLTPHECQFGESADTNPNQRSGMSKDPTYDGECYRCDLDMHYCGGCGDPLRHDGKQFDGAKHPECTA